MPDREEKTERLKKELLDDDNYNRPTICTECGGIMIFKGVGEYKCEKCGCIGFDDYGKARNYIELHPGATMAEVASETGVAQKAIRSMIKECRLEIAPTSNVFFALRDLRDYHPLWQILCQVRDGSSQRDRRAGKKEDEHDRIQYRETRRRGRRQAV